MITFPPRLGCTLFMLVGLGTCAWLARQPLLQGVADLWIVSDNVTQADAAVVLGGQTKVRPVAAADLYKRGLIKRVLVSNNEVTSEGVIVRGDMKENQRVLLKLGVPKDVIDTFGLSNKSTRDEAVALREWVERYGASNMIIPTELFAARRVRWIFKREFAGTGIRIQVLSLEPPGYTRTDWWKKPDGLLTFRNEVIKYVYYRLKY